MASILYFSHGGGPLPILGDPSHDKMIAFMKKIPDQIDKPDAIVVFSAHWEENKISIQSGSEHELFFDYYGFPEEAYKIKYPCKGDSDLANEIFRVLCENNIECKLDSKRPYDHGSYIPLIMMYPNADIPVIQVSLNHNLDPQIHIDLGMSLRPLKEKNILFVGSGFSFHNMQAFDFKGLEENDARNNTFQDSLIDICCKEEEHEKRLTQLKHWKELPNARYCHPREEHLLPLHVCAGIASSKANKVFDDYILGKRAVAFLWTE